LPAIAGRSQSSLAKREKGIWQRRYWEHAIRNDTDLTRHIDYIHFNPVKHGLVASVRLAAQQLSSLRSTRRTTA
jgi:putative transposase